MYKSNGHVEAVQIEYDSEITSFENILDVYFKTFDPTDDGGQFFDRGKVINLSSFIMMKNRKGSRVKETTN